MVGESAGDAPELAASVIALASPKSSTFTVPSARTLMLAGFRSRWMMPCSCAASSASAICLAIGSASSSGTASARALRKILTLHQLHHQRARLATVFESVNVGDVRVIQRRQSFRLALKSCETIGIGGKCLRKNLQRDVAAKLRIAGAIHLAHPTGAERTGDLVRAESGTAGEGHGVRAAG